MKIAPPRSDQEKIVAAFAEASFSSAGLFHPNQWRKTQREPADLILKVGRSMFLFNLKKSKNEWFETACLHNLHQASDRIAEWKAGAAIRGANAFNQFVIAWDDIDNIAVISVVDTPGDGCCYNHPDFVGHRDKLACAVTITSDILQLLANLGGGARELVALCSHLCATPGLVPSTDIHKELVKSHQGFDDLAWLHRPTIDNSPRELQVNDARTTFLLARRMMVASRHIAGQRPEQPWASDTFCQLSWYDQGRIAAFAGEVAPRLWDLPDGEIRPAVAFVKFETPNLRFGVGVSTYGKMVDLVSLSTEPEHANLHLYWLFHTSEHDLGATIIFGTESPKIVDEELTKLRLSLRF